MKIDRIKEDAELYRIGLESGDVNPNDVIKWAEKLIEKNDIPPDEIIEISLSSGINEIISKLNHVKGEYDF